MASRGPQNITKRTQETQQTIVVVGTYRDVASRGSGTTPPH